jgi:hypothetical protein
VILELALAALVGAAVALAVAAAVRARSAVVEDIFDARLEAEIDRARRYEHSVALVSLGIGPDAAVNRVPASPAVRTTDAAGLRNGRLVLMLPQADRACALATVDRFAPALGPWIDSPRLAFFPEDGVTVAALLDVLDGSSVQGVRGRLDAPQPLRD